MSNTKVNRLTGSALVVGSLLFILNKLADICRVYLNIAIPDLITGRDGLALVVGLLALVVGFFGCYLVYAERCNRGGKIGLMLLLSGGVLLALGHITFTPLVQDAPLFLLVILGGALIFAGLGLFGANNLYSHTLEYWQPLPLVTGLFGIVGFIVIGGENNPVIFLALRTFFGAGLLLMGVVLWQDKRTSPEPGKQIA